MTNKIKLSDIVKIAGRVGWKGYTVDDLREDGPWVIGANDITNDNRLDLSKAKHISREKFEESPEIVIEVNDILIVKVGSSIGKVAIVKNDIGEACINPNSVILKNCKINPSYLYYYLISSAGQAFLKNNSSASAQSALNQTTLKEMLIDIVDRKSQDLVANLLDRLNLKIELNNKINAELEAMAKTLYDYWFVQFDFPNVHGKPYKSSGGKMVYNEELKREIPEGWEVHFITKEMDLQYGYPFSTDLFNEDEKGVPVIRIRDILNCTISNYSTEKVDEKYKLNKGDILVGMDGNFHINYWDKDNCYLNQRTLRIRSNKNSISEMQARFSIEPYIKARENNVSRTTVAHLSAKDVNDLKILKATSEIQNKANEFFKSTLNKIISNSIENQELASLRDWLLPMLMNGQVTVGDVEEKLGLVAERSVGYKNS